MITFCDYAYMHANELNEIEKVDSYYYENDPPSWIYMETLREKKMEHKIKYAMILRKSDGPGHF